MLHVQEPQKQGWDFKRQDTHEVIQTHHQEQDDKNTRKYQSQCKEEDDGDQEIP